MPAIRAVAVILGLGVGIGLLQVDHQHAGRHAHLDRREADAVGGVHGLEHVLDQRAQLGIEALDGLGHGLQARVGRLDNLANGHGQIIGLPVPNGKGTTHAYPIGRRARSACASVPSSR